jgi:hypothetical protein
MRTLLDPRLGDRLAAHEDDDGGLADGLDGLDELELRADEAEVAQVDVLARRRVRARRPEQRLVERPRADHHDRDVARLRRLHRRREPALVVRPQLAALRIVDLHSGIINTREVLLHPRERRDAVVGRVEEDVVAERDAVRLRADERDGGERRGREWERRAAVLEQHDLLLLHLVQQRARRGGAQRRVVVRVRVRVFEQTHHEFDAQDGAHGVVDGGDGHGAVADRVGEREEGVRAAAHLAGEVLDDGLGRRRAVADGAVQVVEHVDGAGVGGDVMLVAPFVAELCGVRSRPGRSGVGRGSRCRPGDGCSRSRGCRRRTSRRS